MTSENDSNNSQSEDNSSSRLPSMPEWRPTLPPFKVWLKEKFLRTANKKPAYRITQDGIARDWFNFNKTETLPFDKDTYRKTQLFLGDYANPWYVNLEGIKEEYDEFGHDEPITNLIEANHVIPSQKYKNYMNQTVLNDTFQAGGLRSERIRYILYATLGVGLLNLLVMIT